LYGGIWVGKNEILWERLNLKKNLEKDWNNLEWSLLLCFFLGVVLRFEREENDGLKDENIIGLGL